MRAGSIGRRGTFNLWVVRCGELAVPLAPWRSRPRWPALAI